MFNSAGSAYAAEPTPAGKVAEAPIESRFVLWFNGNGIPERYWIPAETGVNYSLTPCLAPLAPFRNDMHVITGLDNFAAGLPGPGNGHHNSMSGLMTCTRFTGRGGARRLSGHRHKDRRRVAISLDTARRSPGSFERASSAIRAGPDGSRASRKCADRL